jgi:ATP-dependent Clp protease ATP-binding subunit ClpB
MRQDKLTTKLQEALADAQSLAVGNDNQYIEPAAGAPACCWLC